MEFSINSRKLGRVFTFSRPGPYYVYIDLNGKPGMLGNQICDGGALSGSTITCFNDDQDRFERICKRWWRAYLKRESECQNTWTQR